MGKVKLRSWPFIAKKDENECIWLSYICIRVGRWGLGWELAEAIKLLIVFAVRKPLRIIQIL